MFAGRRRGAHQRDFYAMYLLLQLASQVYQLEYKPLVTLGVMGLLAGSHFSMIPGLDFYPYGLRDACVIPALVLRGQLWRLLLAPVAHASDYHLAYNLSSMLWKGHNLERRHGSVGFALMLAVIWVLAGVFETALATALAAAGLGWLAGDDGWGCSVGFSGVLFGLKVVLNNNGSAGGGDAGGLFGFPAAGRYAVWAEAVLVSMFMRSTSLLGHVGGVLAGMAYVRLAHAGYVSAVLLPLQAAVDALLIELGIAPRPPGGGGGGEGEERDPAGAGGWPGGGGGWPGGGGGGGGMWGGRPGPRFYGGGVPLGATGGGGDGVRYRHAAGR